ncbi:alginate lyase family protein [Amycolatopsis sp. NPDC051903]|uniref:alginate lyase family protein n=1 Tax=Amycolatopsis sp. NPDC051903 TaxID=3363936 RepID=UPI003795E146
MLPPSRSRCRLGRLSLVLATVTGLLATAAGAAGAAPAQQPPVSVCSLPIGSLACRPDTVVLDGARLTKNRVGLLLGDRTLRTSLGDLLKQADAALTKGPWTVVDKDRVPPSGDKHDYLSLAPYWWPSQSATADNPQGCPYVQRDGVLNPETTAVPDKAERLTAFSSIYQLSLAWFYTRKPEYAQRAALDLRTWFLDAATKMNPNLNFAQGIPCKNDGRGIGIIEFAYTFTQVLDAAQILSTGAPGWSKTDATAMQGWSADFLTWLRTSQNGKDEAAETNNHGSFYDMLTAGIALYTGDRTLAGQIVLAAEKTRLDHQIAADGSQPEESTRTRSFHYHTFNLVALTRLAQIGRHVGVDLWSYRTPEGGSLFKAVDHLLPAATGGASQWPLPDLNFLQYAALDSVHAAADAGDAQARAALPHIPAPPGGDLYPVRPAAEQLDDISVTG